MASTVDEAPLHTPPAEEKVDELFSGGESPTLNKNNIRSKEDHKPAVSSPRRNGIPPKRPTTAAKAPAASTVSKTVSTSRPPPSGGLSKPPARPMATSSGRRPAIGVNAATASNSGHVARPSTSSTEDTKKAPISPGVENRRPIVSGTAKRVSLAPAASSRSANSKPTPSADRRSTIGSSSTTEKKPNSSRGGVVSPTRTSTRSQAATARSAAALGTTRTSRPPPSFAKALPGAEGPDIAKKRLSTIPASPAPAPPVSDRTASPSVKDTRPVRPVLTTRKSTLSITIEQRLREMELVSQMLQVAMAEDGDETDEVKEQYGKKMDETLADLRERLEQARRNEGKPPLDPPANQPGADGGNTPAAAVFYGPDDLSSDEVAELRAVVIANEQKLIALKSELESAHTKMLQYSKEAAEVPKDVEQATEGIRKEHASKINQLSILHTSEIAKLRAQLADQHAQQTKRHLHDIEAAKASAIDQGSEKIAQVLEEQKLAHEEVLKTFDKQLETEKRNASSMTSELTMLKAKLEEESQRSSERLAEMEQQYRRLLSEKEGVIEGKKEETAEAQQKLEQLRVEHNYELKELEATNSQRIDDMQRSHSEALKRIQDLESNADIASIQHEELLQTRENEISSMSKVIESLQDDLQSLRESKDREADAIKIKLIQDHEAKISEVQAEHELALHAGQDEARNKESSSKANYEQQIRDLEGRLEATEEAHRGALTDVTNVTSSKNEMQKSIESLQNEVVGLKKVLVTLGQESKDKENQHLTALKKMREELDDTRNQLEEKSKDNKALTESRAAEIENLKQSHADEIKTLKLRNDEQAGNTVNEMQKKLDELEQQLADTNSNHGTALDTVKAEHTKDLQTVKDICTSKLEKTENSHNNEIEQLKDAHTKEIEEIRGSCNKELEGARKSHTEEIEQLKDSHMKELEDTRDNYNKQFDKAKDTHKLELDEAQDSHTKKLEELKISYTKELEETKDSHIREIADIHSAHRTELAELKASHAQEVEEARSSLTNELEKVKDARARLEKLKISYEKDLEELKDSHRREVEGLRSDLAQAKEDMDAKSTENVATREIHTTQTNELKRHHGESISMLQHEHQKALTELQEQVLQNRKALADAETELQSTRESQSSAERDTREKHEKELDELRQQFGNAESEGARLQEELDALRQENLKVETLVQQRSAECDELRSALVNARETIAKLTAEAEEASKVMSDTFEIDQLRREIELTREKHEAEVAKLQETISLDSEKREKERKQGAEVRDRLVAQLEELEGFRHELPAAKEQVKEQQDAITLAKKETQDVQEKLKQALETSKDNETRYKETAAELEKLRTESAKTKNKIKGHARISSEVVQELDALQIIADKEREKTDRMKKQIVEITATAESQAARVREMEAALKVATAELAEMKTKRANGKGCPASPAAKRGLRTSRWAAESDEDGFVEVAGDPEHEELGSSIEGTMAGLQEQIRQLEGVNDDMIGESERLVNMLSRATGNKSDVSLDSPKPHSPLNVVTNS